LPFSLLDIEDATLFGECCIKISRAFGTPAVAIFKSGAIRLTGTAMASPDLKKHFPQKVTGAKLASAVE
jgi:hypothetical protein